MMASTTVVMTKSTSMCQERQGEHEEGGVLAEEGVLVAERPTVEEEQHAAASVPPYEMTHDEGHECRDRQQQLARPAATGDQL